MPRARAMPGGVIVHEMATQTGTFFAYSFLSQVSRLSGRDEPGIYWDIRI